MSVQSDERYDFMGYEEDIEDEYEGLLETIDSIRVRYGDSLDDFDHEILNLLERLVEVL